MIVTLRAADESACTPEIGLASRAGIARLESDVAVLDELVGHGGCVWDVDDKTARPAVWIADLDLGPALG